MKRIWRQSEGAYLVGNFDFDRDRERIEQKKAAYKQRRKDEAKDALCVRMTKNMETIMIGALEEIENSFGFLWGHKENRSKTKEEIEFSEMWQDLRSRILDRSNHKIMQSEKEFDKYEIEKSFIKIRVENE